jgi:hypothetical protein
MFWTKNSLCRKYLMVGCFIFAFLLFLLPYSVSSRTLYDSEKSFPVAISQSDDTPYVDIGVHNVGRIGMTVANTGTFGTGVVGILLDPITGQVAPSCIYPYPGNNNYLFAGAFWVGAVVGNDTLVSIGMDGWQQVQEMWPDPYPKGAIVRRSTLNNDYGALSEQDIIAQYTDTLTDSCYVADDLFEGRPHIPLGIEITQKSYGWSASFLRDFILFDYSIKNISQNTLNSVYMGIYVDGDVGPAGADINDATDDICGFKRAISSPQGCGFIDTVNIAWIADNDGRTYNGIQSGACPAGFELTAVTGTRLIRTPSDSLKYSFNWWLSNGNAALDFGPRRAGTDDDPFRDFGGFLGTPEGDRNKYYIMRHEEFDYDQLFTAVNQTSDGWLAPPSQAANFANGYDTRYLLSFGPFDILPGESLPLSFAYVAGAGLHTDCSAFGKLFNANNPQPYYDYLNFENLGNNALWASYVYDIPGYDTDGDGYRGKYRLCAYDTFYYEGDGVPDYQLPVEPPPPYIKVYPRVSNSGDGQLRVRFNGFKPETSIDIFSGLADFEGYRIYFSETAPSPYSNYYYLTTYDREDYSKYIWNALTSAYHIIDPPFTLDSLRALYGADFAPLTYDKDNPFQFEDSIFYFAKFDMNSSSISDTNYIHKIYPSQKPPTTLNIDSALIYHPDELTADSNFKYYEYEYIVKNLLPEKLYYIAVTAFDYGWPQAGIGSLQSPLQKSIDSAYTNALTDVADDARLAESFKLYQNHPNPFNSATTISFDLPRRENVTLTIYNMLGQVVKEFAMGEKPAGSYSVRWDGADQHNHSVASGVYLYKIKAGNFEDRKKLTLLK